MASEQLSKKKRTQFSSFVLLYELRMHLIVRSCDSCRLRRVKCIRDTLLQPCEGCSKRNIRCTQVYLESKSHTRNGKLVVQARERFGSATQDLVLQQGGPAFDSAEGRLTLGQNEDFIAAALLSHFNSFLLHATPMTQTFQGVLRRFEEAGRRISALSQSDAIICDLAMARAARITDLPIVLGSDAPKLEQVKEMRSTDLTVWGDRRESFCRSMEERARKRTDQAIKASSNEVQAIAALFMLQELDDTSDFENPLRPRPLAAAGIEKLRARILQPGKADSDPVTAREELSFIISALITDAMMAFHCGRPLMINDDDVILFRPCLLNLTPDDAVKTVDNLVAACAWPAQLEKTMWPAFMELLDHPTFIARYVHRHMTSPRAKMQSPTADPLLVRQLAEHLSVLLTQVDRMHTRLMQMDFDKSIIFDGTTALHFGGDMLIIFLREVVGEQAKWVLDAQVKADLTTVAEAMNAAFMTAIRSVARIAQMHLQQGSLIGKNLLYSSLPTVADVLLRLPSSEEGGPPDWSLSQKIEDIDWVLRAIRHLGWAYSVSAERAPALQARLDELRISPIAVSEASSTTADIGSAALTPALPTLSSSVEPTLFDPAPFAIPEVQIPRVEEDAQGSCLRAAGSDVDFDFLLQPSAASPDFAQLLGALLGHDTSGSVPLSGDAVPLSFGAVALSSSGVPAASVSVDTAGADLWQYLNADALSSSTL